MKFEVLEMVNENNKKALREKEEKKLKNRIKKLFNKVRRWTIWNFLKNFGKK